MGCDIDTHYFLQVVNITCKVISKYCLFQNTCMMHGKFMLVLEREQFLVNYVLENLLFIEVNVFSPFSVGVDRSR